MTTSGRIMSLAIAVVVLAAPVRGQQATQAPAAVLRYIDERAGMSLDDAVARARDREPSLRAARADIDVARGRRQQAGLRSNPMFTLEYRDEPAGTDNLTTVGVEWPLDLFRRSGRVQSAEREVQATELAVTDRERRLVADVRLHYGVAAAAVRELSVVDELVATAARQLDLVRARVEAGRTPPLERDLLEVELRRLETERMRAIGRADVAMVQVKQLLGMGPEDSMFLRETLESLVRGSVLPAVTPSAASIGERADVREAESQVTLADVRIDQARRDGRIDVSLFGAYMRMDTGFPQQGFSSTGGLERVRGQFNYVAAGAKVMVPLFNGNQGQVAAAQAARAGAEARHEAVELAARAEVAAAQARDTQAQRAVALYIGGLLKLARQNLDVVRQTFELGRATVFDVVTEQRRFWEIEQGYTTALREAWEAHASLRRALGETR